MARKFTKYPSNYVKATAYYVSKTQMNDWKQIARAYAKKVGAELLFVNENSFGIEYPDGTMRHIRIEDLVDLLGAEYIDACSNIKASTIGNDFEIGDIVEIHTSMDGWFGEYEVIREAEPEDYVRLSQNYMQDYLGTKYLLKATEPGFIDEIIETSRNMRKIHKVEACGSVKCSTDIKASNDNYTWDRNRFDTIVGKILEYWESMEEGTCTSKEIYDYLAQFGITNIDPDEFNKAWDRAVAISGAYFELEDSPVTLSNGLEISNKKEAYTWLRENVEQYGNTYFWDSSLKSDLDKLVERFGNTYFWRS